MSVVTNSLLLYIQHSYININISVYMQCMFACIEPLVWWTLFAVHCWMASNMFIKCICFNIVKLLKWAYSLPSNLHESPNLINKFRMYSKKVSYPYTHPRSIMKKWANSSLTLRRYQWGFSGIFFFRCKTTFWITTITTEKFFPKQVHVCQCDFRRIKVQTR